MQKALLPGLLLTLVVAGCSSTPPRLPYPAFVQTDELPDVFMATLPGVRAKRYAEDYAARTGRFRVDVPADWSGSSGGTPDGVLEIFVLEGELTVGDVKLIPGGYAYLPSGSLGFRLQSASGARILYLVSPEDPVAVIQSPIIDDGVMSEWTPAGQGLQVRMLREDPGSGARTWLLRVGPEAAQAWRRNTVALEGYLVSGQATVSECFEGRARTGSYTTGGYFVRPGGTTWGGGDTAVAREAVWFLREMSAGSEAVVGSCPPDG